MINLFEHYDTASADFLRSQYLAKMAVPSVAMYDNGFLPKEVDSPIQYFCNFSNNHQPLYFDKLSLPYYWRVMSTAAKGEVFDLDKKRAEIFYSANDNSRIVKEVHWLDNVGNISWIDHYNRHGQRFGKTYYEQEKPVLKKFYNRQGKVVIYWNLQAGDLFLSFDHDQRHFSSLEDFVIYYLELRHYKLDHIFYNTLNKSLAVSLRLKQPGEDVLFWHERTGKELPGNMQFLLDNETRTKHIVFQNYLDWQRRDEFLPADHGTVDFQYLGMIYPHPRSNNMKQNALILTNSDQIEQIDQLVKLLPNINFKIAAITEMSGKLMSLQDFKNVELFPTVSKSRLRELMADCDVYLDINYGNEILDAVRGAFEKNMLVLGFKDTLHNKQFIAPENVFEKGAVKEMAQRILQALVQPALMKKLIDRQRMVAGDVRVADYQRVLGEFK
ncbi:accessory Sec system glycosyltransferase GtfB [Limosilactobacillus reuteri]|nr:accessory Sec system glycosyltransferase GtfB [Limosilactobacillus reuteri]